MKASEVRERTDEELENMQQDLQRELWKARFDNFTNQLDDTSRINKLRRDIARVKTVLTERRGPGWRPASTKGARRRDAGDPSERAKGEG